LRTLSKVYGKPDNAGPNWYGTAKVTETIPARVTHSHADTIQQDSLNCRGIGRQPSYFGT